MTFFRRKPAQEKLTESIDKMIRRDLRGGPCFRRPAEIWKIQSIDWNGNETIVTVRLEPRA